ncbi:hypothetical protein HFC70_24545 [Agrobacterium sp. a22-2]|uniref:hypothetical protein n=1 Tax=Agrobacterium sp. a22-2 TaxID=2283840 RepID=UPI0014484F63|nr:hypothetical protein [Agrobacterium sp. a22-2]NKN39520.1 hypothetical protein [Agrobacterium sp. a22-2]
MSVFQWPPENCNPLLLQIGRIILNFNTMENSVKSLLWAVSSQSDYVEHRALVIHMQNVTLCDAILTIANEKVEMGAMKSETRDLISHCIKTFNLTREYRNWYVHGFNGVMTNGDGQIYTHSARSRLAEHYVPITAKDAKWLADWCFEGSHYLATSYGYVARDMGHNIGGVQTPLPDKWPLPNKLKKPLRHHLYAKGSP